MLGVIADDITGGADLAGMLTSKGVRTLLLVERTHISVEPHERWDAIVMALKTRAIAPPEAVSRSLEALHSLLRHGVRQVFFKYCSTFDSTAAGNIGPVIDALMTELGVSFCGLVPALPVNGRTQYLGYLFVKGQLLSETSMRNHPLNPMRDPSLVRHLQAQTRLDVGLVPFDTVRRGVPYIRDVMCALAKDGVSLALLDAIDDGDLNAIADTLVDDRLISGSSGLALVLPGVWERRGLWRPQEAASPAPSPDLAPTLILCGSCSSRTREQVRDVEQLTGPAVHLKSDALSEANVDAECARVLARVRDQLRTNGWSVVASCADGPVSVTAPGGGEPSQQARHIEAVLANLARVAVADLGVRSLVVAGGETAGAVAQAIDLSSLRVGEQLDPGVPICWTRSTPELAVVLKSGNFGEPDLFRRALKYFGHTLPPEGRYS